MEHRYLQNYELKFSFPEYLIEISSEAGPSSALDILILQCSVVISFAIIVEILHF